MLREYLKVLSFFMYLEYSQDANIVITKFLLNVEDS